MLWFVVKAPLALFSVLICRSVPPDIVIVALPTVMLFSLAAVILPC